jgi:hypothetical protein
MIDILWDTLEYCIDPKWAWTQNIFETKKSEKNEKGTFERERTVHETLNLSALHFSSFLSAPTWHQDLSKKTRSQIKKVCPLVPNSLRTGILENPQFVANHQTKWAMASLWLSGLPKIACSPSTVKSSASSLVESLLEESEPHHSNSPYGFYMIIW